MKRIVTAGLLVGLFVFANNPGLAQFGSKEAKIRYRLKDTGKIDTFTGLITDESLEGISVKGAKARTIPAADIIDVDYLEYLPNADRPAARKARAAEKDNKYDEAIALYKKLKPVDKKAARHFEYRIAAILALQAESGGDYKAAIAALEKYMKAHPDSWQMINVPKLLVPLQLHEKDAEGAQRTLDTLSANRNLPASLRQELNLMKTRILMESRKYDEAEKTLGDLIKGTKDEGQIFRLRIQLAECMAANKKLPKAKAELQDIIAKTNNADMKAFALNTLGECCRNNNENREAMWNFLYVDVLYNQNKEEHNRAIKNLAEVFEKLNDAKRAKQYADMLRGR